MEVQGRESVRRAIRLDIYTYICAYINISGV